MYFYWQVKRQRKALQLGKKNHRLKKVEVQKILFDFAVYDIMGLSSNLKNSCKNELRSSSNPQEVYYLLGLAHSIPCPHVDPVSSIFLKTLYPLSLPPDYNCCQAK